MKKVYPKFDDPLKYEERDDQLADDLINTNFLDDEWGSHVRHVIKNTLRTCDYEEAGDFFLSHGLPFLGWYKRSLEDRLISAKFKKEHIKEEFWFKDLIRTIDFAQGKMYEGRWDLNPPFGFPPETYTLSDDKHQMWVKPKIEAALLALQSIKKLKELIIKDDKVNMQAIKVYLRTFELAINILRSGKLPKYLSDGEKQKFGGKTGGGISAKIRQEKSEAMQKQWQAEANRILKKRPGWSKQRVAVEIVKRKKNNGRTADYIRKKIKKPNL
jgi:hypothetical protein